MVRPGAGTMSRIRAITGVISRCTPIQRNKAALKTAIPLATMSSVGGFLGRFRRGLWGAISPVREQINPDWPINDVEASWQHWICVL
jgi:hypothetical protein